jgi:hypothetical protein
MEFCNKENELVAELFDLDITTTENTESTEEPRFFYLFPYLPCFPWFSKNSFMTYFGIDAIVMFSS